MKTLFAVIVVCALTGCSDSIDKLGNAVKDSRSTTGRYQLFTAENIETQSEGNKLKKSVIFKINTETGETWRYERNSYLAPGWWVKLSDTNYNPVHSQPEPDK